jgi:circadian clock protein KaiC
LTQDNTGDAKLMATRLIDHLKLNQITAFFTTLTHIDDSSLERTDIFISSLIDTWLLVKSIETGGERNRGLYVLKSRGMSHSNQIREFLMTDNGIVLQDVYIGLSGVLTGSSRIAQEARDEEEQMLHKHMIEQRKLAIVRMRRKMEANISSLKAEFEAEKAEALKLIEIEEANLKNIAQTQEEIAKSRNANGKKKSKQIIDNLLKK